MESNLLLSIEDSIFRLCTVQQAIRHLSRAHVRVLVFEQRCCGRCPLQIKTKVRVIMNTRPRPTILVEDRPMNTNIHRHSVLIFQSKSQTIESASINLNRFRPQDGFVPLSLVQNEVRVLSSIPRCCLCQRLYPGRSDSRRTCV